MKKALKFLHQLGAIGVIGALVSYLLLAATVTPESPAEYFGLRQGIALISTWMLLPSLALVLTSGLLAIAVHHPFMEARWVWLKAALGLTMFEGTLATVQSTADRAARLSAGLADGTADTAALEALIEREWLGVAAILALSLANVVLAVWRPRLAKRVPAPVDAGSVAR